MKGKGKQIWLEEGYQMISENSFTKVNVESIARVINKNKSSFYHYFGDWEGYEKALLVYHLHLAEAFSEKISACEQVVPDMLNILLEHRSDIFFHKQLRIHRDKPHYKSCFESVYLLFENAILDKWKSFLLLDNQTFLASKFLGLITENFLLKITPENYSYDWLSEYFIEVSGLVRDINQDN